MKPKPWRVNFNEYGGYDCMTGAWEVRDADDEIVVRIDQGDYGQELCSYAFRSKEAEELANKIASL